MPRLSVYVAGSSAELERVEQAQLWLQQSGVEVVSSWAQDVLAAGEGNPLALGVRRRCARKDLAEIRRAGLLWLLVPRQAHSHGAFCELGYALGLNKRIVCSGPTKRSIFPSLAVEVGDDRSACDYILTLQTGEHRGQEEAD